MLFFKLPMTTLPKHYQISGFAPKTIIVILFRFVFIRGDDIDTDFDTVLCYMLMLCSLPSVLRCFLKYSSFSHGMYLIFMGRPTQKILGSSEGDVLQSW